MIHQDDWQVQAAMATQLQQESLSVKTQGGGAVVIEAMGMVINNWWWCYNMEMLSKLLALGPLLLTWFNINPSMDM